jgi:hypothetical protein
MSARDPNFAYLMYVGMRANFAVGDYVALLDDTLNTTPDATNVLGKFADHNVGEIMSIVSTECVEVRFGSDRNIGIYDVKSLGFVSVTLAPSAPSTGVLKTPSEQKVGYIKAWSNYGKGDTVLVTAGALPSTSYKVCDLMFHITVHRPPANYTLSKEKMKGGSYIKRKTVKRTQTKAFFTRFLKRV